MKTLHFSAKFGIDKAEATIAYWYGGTKVTSYRDYLRAFSKSKISTKEYLYARFILVELQDILKLLGASTKPEAPGLAITYKVEGTE